MKFRHVPTEVEAIQFLDAQPAALQFAVAAPPGWLIEAYGKGEIEASLVENMRGCWVHSGHGPVLARPGDWIIRNPDGGIYPVDPETFAKTYEAIK